MANWERWEVEKPDWFTEHWISAVPNEFLPRPEPNRRRSSVFRSLLGLPAEGNDGGAKRGSTKSTSKVAAEDGDEQ